MFQQTIQDLLAIADGGSYPREVLRRLQERIVTFERMEGGEILAQTDRGLLRFELAPGLADLGPALLTALADQPTLRFDTAAQMREAGLNPPAGLSSVLLLRLETPGVTAAALMLGHARAWSFPAAPLSRIRAMGGLALRLLIASSPADGTALGPKAPSAAIASAFGDAELISEVARLRAHISTLDAEITGLRNDPARRRSGKPR